MLHRSDPEEVTAWALAERAAGARIGFVPTMGFLHEGHRSLMRLLRPQVDRLVVSIYVNPLQFAPHEDFAAYPRDMEGDLAACAEEVCDLVFLPETLYPEGFETRISVPALDRSLCSLSRPHFFTGVATVVHRLFRVVRPHVAAFGEKDYQQLAVIRRMVRDLDMGIEIVGGPIVRETDGLAMSSRNAYLSLEQRERATSLHAALRDVLRGVAAGTTDVPALLERARSVLDVDGIDYLEIVDADTLQPVARVDRPCRVAVAARVGATRLIDNMAVIP
jgi:pantoate--beta-alanine ligase